MKKKLAAVLAMTVCATTVFAACGNPEKNVYREEKATAAYTSMTKLSDYNDYTLVPTTENYSLVQFSKEDGDNTTVVVYNIELGKEVYKQTYATASKNYDVQLNKDGFAVTVTEFAAADPSVAASRSVSVYDVSGTSVITKTVAKKDLDTAGEYAVTFHDLDNDGANDYIKVGTVAYKKEGSAFAESFDFKDRAKTDFSGIYVGDKIIEQGQHGIYTYNADLTLAHYYELPGYEMYYTVVALDSGNYLVQYQYLVDSHAKEKEYDFYDTQYTGSGILEMKGKIVTEFVNTKKDKVKEIDCDYIFNSYERASALENRDVNTDGNAALIYTNSKIVDKRIATLENTVTLTVSEKGKIKEMDTLIDNQKMGQGKEVQKVFGYYYVEDVSDQGYLVDKKGEVKMAVKYGAGVYYNDKFAVYNDKVYNSSLTEMTLPGEEYSVFGLMTDYVVLEKDTTSGNEYYKWDGSSLTSIASATERFEKWNKGYKKTVSGDTSDTYYYYNAAGTELANSTFDLTYAANNTEGTAYLYSGLETTDTGVVTVYYLVK